jgi:succinate dehydrogenase assembly factor 1
MCMYSRPQLLRTKKVLRSKITAGFRMKHSGLQKSVLSLYRKCLREVRKKPLVSPPPRMPTYVVTSLGPCLIEPRRMHKTTSNFSRGNSLSYHYSVARASELMFPLISNSGLFRKNSVLSKTDFATVEFLLRKGYKQLEFYSSPGVKNIIC